MRRLCVINSDKHSWEVRAATAVLVTQHTVVAFVQTGITELMKALGLV